MNDGMNSADFIKNVGAEYLNDAFGTSSGTPTALKATVTQCCADSSRHSPADAETSPR